jgi:hypothetical protein
MKFPLLIAHLISVLVFCSAASARTSQAELAEIPEQFGPRISETVFKPLERVGSITVELVTPRSGMGSVHRVHVLRDANLNRAFTCMVGNDNARLLLGQPAIIVVGSPSKVSYQCVDGTESFERLAQSGAFIDPNDAEKKALGDTAKRINPETGEEEEDTEFWWPTPENCAECFGPGGGGGGGSNCLKICTEKFAPTFARCRSLAYPPVVAACVGVVSVGAAACVVACL